MAKRNVPIKSVEISAIAQEHFAGVLGHASVHWDGVIRQIFKLHGGVSKTSITALPKRIPTHIVDCRRDSMAAIIVIAEFHIELFFLVDLQDERVPTSDVEAVINKKSMSIRGSHFAIGIISVPRK